MKHYAATNHTNFISISILEELIRNGMNVARVNYYIKKEKSLWISKNDMNVDHVIEPLLLLIKKYHHDVVANQ